MSDDAAPLPPETPPVAEPTGTIMGLPMAAFVRGGGTSTTADDNRRAEEEHDAELRRDSAARDRELASIPIEQGGAKMYANQLTTRPELEKGYVLLRYLTRSGEQLYDEGQPVMCLADIIVGADPALPTELTLILVCPSCLERGLPQGQCQLRLRQTNRRWEFDTKRAGEMFPFDDGFGVRMYRLAGRVVESERFSCDRCLWAARIDDNRVWQD